MPNGVWPYTHVLWKGRDRRARFADLLFSFELGMGGLHIVFVCTGNICRSPTAERLTAAYAASRHLTEMSASSAGTRAVVGQQIHPKAARVLRELGGDDSNFAARQFTARVARTADLILTMTTDQRDTVLQVVPQKLHRTFSLSEAAALVSARGASTIADLASLRGTLSSSLVTDIPDPIGEEDHAFVSVGRTISSLLTPVLSLCAGFSNGA
ncbi:MAG: oxygenase MpaB family protein [Actinomycetota bacterium]